MDDDRLQEAINRAEETETAEAGSDATAREDRPRPSRERFRVIFRRALLLMALLLIAALVGVVALFSGGPSNPPPLAGFVILAAVLAALYAAWFLNWRCPECGAYLGSGFWGTFSVRRCLNCGSELA